MLQSSAVEARTEEIGSSFFNFCDFMMGISLGCGVMFAARSCGRGVAKERSENSPGILGVAVTGVAFVEFLV